MTDKSAHAPLVMLAAGGTGGHMAPADAVKDALLARGLRVGLVTDARGAAIGNMLQDVPKTILSQSSHQRGGVLGRLKAFWSLFRSLREVKTYFEEKQPDAVLGFGGYPSLPAIRVAHKMGIPVFLHEQNAVLGRVNRWSARKATTLLLSCAPTSRVPDGVKTLLTGNPVRRSISEAATKAEHADARASETQRTLVVLGGSQGARILSDLVPGAVVKGATKSGQSFRVLQQARPEDIDRVRALYRSAGIDATVEPYFGDVPALLAQADFAICRAGASTIAELSAFACPAVLIPLKIAADDHQTANARIVAGAGGAKILTEEGATPDSLAALIEPWLLDPAALRSARDQMKASRVSGSADRIVTLIEGHLSPSTACREGAAA